MIRFVLPQTTADVPFPPAYKLFPIVESFTWTYVFCVTVPWFPPPYIVSSMLAFVRFTYVFVLMPAWSPPPYILDWVPPVTLTFVSLQIALFPPPYTS